MSIFHSFPVHVYLPFNASVMELLNFSLNLQSQFSCWRQDQDSWTTPFVTRSIVQEKDKFKSCAKWFIRPELNLASKE